MTIFPYFHAVFSQPPRIAGPCTKASQRSASPSVFVACTLALAFTGAAAQALVQGADLAAQLRLDTENPTLLLKQGVALAQEGQVQAAIVIFQALKQRFPQQPAPYANLAALYAQTGQLEEARQMLLLADRWQNDRFPTQLGLASLNLELALQAYDTALALRPQDDTVLRKRNALSRLLSPQAGAGTGATAPSAPKEQTPTTLSVGPDAALPTSGTPSGAARDRLVLSDAAPFSASPKGQLSKEDAAAPASPQSIDVRNALVQWAQAWSQKSFPGYAAQYSETFRPSRDMDVVQWTARKKALMAQAKYIQVDVQVDSIRIDQGVATVRLQQRYQSDQYSDTSNKEIQLRQEKGQWKITREIELR
ncbi:L,D-transpeptidase Cds6 family protein [Rhodoferax aquaticus]|uniref:Tetratricopeptide repeat protein n=1 Tax=Rhodoferax aquaticus TaxID=2527691 RepID=A0A515EL62_9BURK|nr:tetratricopeptide repeat protein [Rhodoferax aquaticus]QDL53397.1 tetratricopeptide repeat protein [Rhodoferax aquaticus]